MEASSDYERIELFLNCRNLRDLDVFSKSDPYVKVSYRRDFTAQGYVPIGRTETLKNQLNPNFGKSFLIDYVFESRQDIRFELWDDDGGDDQFIGSVQTTVGNLMGAQSQTSVMDLVGNGKKGKDSGKLIVRCEKVEDSNQYLTFKWRAEKLMNTDSFFDFWDKSDPYLRMMKIRNDNSCVEVHRTEAIEDNLEPIWQPFEIQAARLINRNKQAFKIEVWDYEEQDPDQFIGEITLTLDTLVKGAKLPLQNPKKKKAGLLVLDDLKKVVRPSFIDYLRGGLQLNMITAVDFTASNGITSQPTSLHYLDPQKPNQYQLAIAAISQILMAYDSDKKIASFGFGAKPKWPAFCKPNPQLNHCFPLSGNEQQIQAEGVPKLLEWYTNAITNVELSGPTRFAPVVREAIKIASICKAKGSLVYQTLLILTDGTIHDMDETTGLLVEAAYLPLSLIIVGVGNADFHLMDKMDGDGDKRDIRHKRDIVQFVPLRDQGMNGDCLAREVLAELPQQVTQYMELIGKPPGQFVPPNLESLVPPAPQPQPPPPA